MSTESAEQQALRKAIAANSANELEIRRRMDAHAERCATWRAAGRELEKQRDDLERELRASDAEYRDLAYRLSVTE